MKSSELHTFVYQLATRLGGDYQVSLNDTNLIEINTPFENHIGDNIRIFISPKINHQYYLDDDGDSLNEFGMENFDLTDAKRYIKQQHVDIDSQEEVISMTVDEVDLYEAIFEFIGTQLGLDALLFAGHRIEK